ncbi:MAG: nicotinamide riboside transporter PnuC [Candidatus Dormibacteria bacterium]
MTKTLPSTTVFRPLGYCAGVLGSVILIAGAATHRVPMDLTEVLGFVTGGWGVWLTVKANIWNWPIGIANSAFYLVLFFQARLFADMSLQVVHIVLGFLGWYWWMRGGESRTPLSVGRTRTRVALALVAITLAATTGLTIFLTRVHDSAPFLDALTTVLSLVAQYLLTRKLIENWFVWITADMIYIGLYASRHLYLTSVLYAVFLAMCIAGVAQWRTSLRRSSSWSGRREAIDAVAV